MLNLKKPRKALNPKLNDSNVEIKGIDKEISNEEYYMPSVRLLYAIQVDSQNDLEV